ncbi:MAG: 4Fe-4S dicluster domain-containing protein [Dehalococcoidales bacterium]|nr:4Fe-4S dicluster domain-containing protein [Dehalococcoidales bacterium]
MGKQYGFYFDESRCILCRTCEISCKAVNKVEYGVSWRKVFDIWSGEYPDVKRRFFSKSCMHCENPPCVPACPVGAITKREDDGIVVVDAAICNGCRDCLDACPWDIPQFGNDGKMQKCDYCLGAGQEPACTMSCPGEALFYGTLDELEKRTGVKKVRRMDGEAMPSMIIVR